MSGAGTDTVTVLDTATVPGDSMSESLRTQADGETQGKLPKVEISLAGNDERERLVGAEHSLPVEVKGLADMAADIKRIRELLELFLAST